MQEAYKRVETRVVILKVNNPFEAEQLRIESRESKDNVT